MKLEKVFVQSNHNRPSGGTKDVHLITTLFRKRGFEAYVFSPKLEVYQPTWFWGVSPVISNEDMARMCRENDLIIGGWPDLGTQEIIRRAPAKVKVFWPQSSFFLKSKSLIGDEPFTKKDYWGYTHFWAMCYSNKEILDRVYGINSYLVHHYFFPNNSAEYIKGARRKRQILCFARKGERFIRFAKFIMGKKIPFVVIDKAFSEGDFFRWAAESQFFLSTTIGYELNIKKMLRRWAKYVLTLGKGAELFKAVQASGKPIEAFTLLPSEAVIAGSVVIGFDGEYGKSEWMSSENSFVAKQGSYLDLVRAIKQALVAPEEKLKTMNMKAIATLKHYDENFTWDEITAFLKDAGFEF